jgi:hypothetical protein
MHLWSSIQSNQWNSIYDLLTFECHTSVILCSSVNLFFLTFSHFCLLLFVDSLWISEIQWRILEFFFFKYLIEHSSYSSRWHLNFWNGYLWCHWRNVVLMQCHLCSLHLPPYICFLLTFTSHQINPAGLFYGSSSLLISHWLFYL